MNGAQIRERRRAGMALSAMLVGPTLTDAPTAYTPLLSEHRSQITYARDELGWSHEEIVARFIRPNDWPTP